jgi:hypothetical protein
MRFIVYFALLVSVALCPTARAQAPAPTPSVEELQKALQAVKEDAAAVRKAATQLSEQNDNLRKRVEGKEAALWDHYYKAKESDYDFQIEMMNINSRSFQHQNVASYVILGLVVCVVLAGLYFAQIQLMAGLQPIATLAAGAPAPGTITTGAATDPAQVPAPVPAPALSPAPFGTTTLAAEVGKVTVTSSVVGVIVLVISLAFLYIYTREVYHIQVVDPYRPALKDPAIQTETSKGAAPGK